MEDNESFEYTYSAPEQEEIRRIRDKYLPGDPREEKLAQLRRLDADVSRKAARAAIGLGVVSTLVFGTGMCLCLEWRAFIPGVLVGLVGIVGMALAYPVYRWVERRQRAKVAPEILRLSQELM